MSALGGSLLFILSYLIAGWVGYNIGNDEGRRAESSKRVRRW